MHTVVQKLNLVKNEVNKIINEKQLKTDPKIIVVSKTFSLNKVRPLIESGHIHFGENKIQEAELKWSKVKATNKNIKLHMVGKLQTNKVKKAIKLFDYIHSLDNEKLALKLSTHQSDVEKKIKLFIQVNIGNENQKSGIGLNELNDFYDYCHEELSLEVIGLMCLPPVNSDSNQYFKILKENAEKLNLKELSMGMSGDYQNAILTGSTYVRLGTLILGERILSN